MFLVVVIKKKKLFAWSTTKDCVLLLMNYKLFNIINVLFSKFSLIIGKKLDKKGLNHIKKKLKNQTN